MSDCSMAQAKRDFARGFLVGGIVESRGGFMVPAQWYIRFVFASDTLGGGPGYLVDARSGHPRGFKTFDAAVSALRQIGLAADCFKFGQQF